MYSVAMCKWNTIDYDSTVKYYGSQIFQQPLQNDIKNIDNYNHNSFNFEASSFQKNIEEEKPLDQSKLGIFELKYSKTICRIISLLMLRH